jgi:energy-coupling factor transporter ATP-binding protein EcfA2
MQRIEVKNFGPLDNITPDIKDYMVFIGPQASGKSTLAKLIYFFWKVEDKFNQEILSTYLINKTLRTHNEDVDYVETFKKEVRKLFTEFFPTHRNGELTYTYSTDYKISFNVTSYNLNFSDDIKLSNGFSNELDGIEELINGSSALTDLLSNKKLKFENLLEIFANELKPRSYGENNRSSDLKRIFVPASRAILSLFANSLTVVQNNSLDYFIENFIKFTNSIRKFLESSSYSDNFGWMARLNDKYTGSNAYLIANQLSLEILKGDFSTDNRGDGIMHYYNGSAYLVPLKYTSSGQQESTWLINLIQYLLHESDENQFDVIIEEPEAHLFPDAQRNITKLITLLNKKEPNKVRLIVTTHSPYILATLNNSIKAFSIAQKGSKYKEVENILSSEFWVDPVNLFVGSMEKSDLTENYNLQDIFDQDIKLIKHEGLDSVSDDIMKQFDDLLEIQYSE